MCFTTLRRCYYNEKYKNILNTMFILLFIILWIGSTVAFVNIIINIPVGDPLLCDWYCELEYIFMLLCL